MTRLDACIILVQHAGLREERFGGQEMRDCFRALEALGCTQLEILLACTVVGLEAGFEREIQRKAPTKP
jgi:hypothetical protein